MSNLTTPERNALPTHITRKPKDTLSKEARKSIGAASNYSPRTKQPGEALKRDNDWRKSEPYKTGDGDHTAQVPRAGSMDAYSLSSRGNRT